MHNSHHANRIIDVRGSHYEMGFQHARQVQHLLPALENAIRIREGQLVHDGADTAFEAVTAETAALLHEIDRATIDMIRGLADGLSLDFERLLHYNLVTFLRDLLTTRRALAGSSGSPSEGCSTWAASGIMTANGDPILAKNRDFSMAHLPLQHVIRAEPASGYRYTYVTSAGSPGVFVAGFNEAGLALVDTHVASSDVGAGLPTFALSMHVLEDCDSVRSALDYLKSVPRLGRNNVLLADARGDMAVFEIGHEHLGVIEAASDVLVNTNHFNSPAMQAHFVNTEPVENRDSTFKRYVFLQAELQKHAGSIDLAFARAVMAAHEDGLSSICRHEASSGESTIATCIFLPVQRELWFSHGLPCEGDYIRFSYSQ